MWDVPAKMAAVEFKESGKLSRIYSEPLLNYRQQWHVIEKQIMQRGDFSLVLNKIFSLSPFSSSWWMKGVTKPDTKFLFKIPNEKEKQRNNWIKKLKSLEDLVSCCRTKEKLFIFCFQFFSWLHLRKEGISSFLCEKHCNSVKIRVGFWIKDHRSV